MQAGRLSPFAAYLIAVAYPLWAEDHIGSEVAARYNLARNSSFEQGGDRPAEWGFHPRDPKAGNRLMRDPTVAHTGKASGLIWSVTPYTPGKPWMQWSQYERVPIEGGSTLIVSCYTKTEGCQPGHVGFHFYGEGRAHLGFTSVPFHKGADEWTYLRSNVQVPEGAKTMGFVLYAREMGKTWYDDAVVLGTPKTTARRGTPKVDGRLDDACWKADGAITDFVVHTGTKLPTEKTRARIAYDDRALYVAFHCPHPRDAELKADAKEHDGTSWLDDSVEIFLDPDHDHRGYFQWTVNCIGAIRDTRGVDTAWESGARCATKREADSWSIELAIPFDKLELNMDVGDVWGINLVRNDRVNGETSTWSLGGFHKAGRFGNVALKPDLTPFFRRDIVGWLDEREVDADRVRAEMRSASLSEHVMREPSRLLGRAEAEIARLRRIASGDARVGRDDWPTIKTKLTEIRKTVESARSAAVQGMFRIDGQGGGFRLVIAHSLQKVRRSGPVVQGVVANRVRLAAARDETESFQLVVIPSGKPLTNVSITAPPLGSPDGEIPIEWNRIGYVETAQPGYPTEYVGWWPDPLLPPGPFSVKADERQPVWLNVVVPPSAKPGIYRGEVTISHGAQSISVPVELRVRNFTLPRPGTLATAFGIYAQVLSNGYYRGPYKEHMKQEDYVRWCEFMGKRRITPKNVARDYISFEREDDQWTFDLSRLKTTVAELAPKYYAPYSFCLHRVPTGPSVFTGIEKGTPPNIAHWAAIVKAIDKEWKRHGLPPQVYIYGVDEPRREIYPFLRKAYAALKKATPEYPIMQTIGDPNPKELTGVVDIWCPLSSRLDWPFYAERVKAGDTLWTYVCCGPKHPYANFFVDRPATEHRVLFWQTWQRKATGFLYWCICYWRGVPSPSTGKKCWPKVPFRFKDVATYKSYKDNGDGLLVYPGPNLTPYSSIRLEVIRDGIEDYEYLALLTRTLAAAKALPRAKQPPQALIEEAEALCVVPEHISRNMSVYTNCPEDIFARRRQVADMVERLAVLVGDG